jgi:hypothetical protein
MGKIQCLLLLTVIAVPTAFAQKVKVGYDKSTDFSKYRSYTWAKPETSPQRPLLYVSLIGSIDQELKNKGLTRVESNGDLTLLPAGGMEYGLNTGAATPITLGYGGPPPAIDATMWTGTAGPSNLMAIAVPEGSLILSFVDQSVNKVVWNGTVTQKLDLHNHKKSLELINKSITKLLKEFPPKK